MLAAEIMTRVVRTVTPETRLPDAIRLMLQFQVSGLPVVDAAGTVHGMLTEGDLLRRAETGTEGPPRSKLLAFLLGPGRSAADYVQCHSRSVKDLMSSPVIAVGPTATLEEVVEQMEKHHIRRVAVMQDDHLLSVVSRSDLLRLELKMLQAPPAPGVKEDLDIEHDVHEEIRRGHFLAATHLRIHANAGVVTLEGTIFDDRLRDALRVAAENVTGVTSVEDRLVTLDPTYGAYYTMP